MKRYNFIIAIILIVIGYSIHTPTKQISDESVFTTIDSLELVISDLESQKNQIEIQTDSIIVEIVKIKDNYETKYIDIVNQSVDSDIKFFTEYLSKND